MTTTRRYRMAPSLARLAARDLGSTDHREGYFDEDADRNAHVTFEPGTAFLVSGAAHGPEGVPAEERHEVPLAHATAILAVARAVADRKRTTFPIEGGTAHLDRYEQASVDLVTVEFADAAAAAAFVAPAWLDAEVTDRADYAPRALAFDGAPDEAEIQPSGAGLSALLDRIEAGAEAEREPVREEGSMEAVIAGLREAPERLDVSRGTPRAERIAS